MSARPHESARTEAQNPKISGATTVSGATSLQSALHLYAAVAFSIVIPMFSRLQSRTLFLSSFTANAILSFIVIWSVIFPGLLLSALFILKSRHQRLGQLALEIVVAVSWGLLCLETFSHRFRGGELGVLKGAAVVVLGIAAGLLGRIAYRRWPWLRSMMSVAAFASLIAPALLFQTYLQASVRPVHKAELTAGNPVPVVMIILDCFCGASLMDENRSIDKKRFPHFAELAEISTWYRNCTSVHPRTDRAIPAILTGSLSHEIRMPSVKDYPQNLFTLVNATSQYQLTCFEPFTLLCPEDSFRDRSPPDFWRQERLLLYSSTAVLLHDLVPPDLPIDTPSVPRVWFGLEHVQGANRQQKKGLIRYNWDVRRDRQMEHFLDCLHREEKPGFWFGHFALPHFPWNYLPSGNSYELDHGLRQDWGTEGVSYEDWADDDQVVIQSQQMHLLQMGYVDRFVGQLIEKMRGSELLDRSLLIVMADHGVSFHKGLSQRKPSEKNLADIMSVPLFIKLPGQTTGDLVDLNVETTDVLATVLDVLKLSPPQPIGGQSLISPEFAELPEKHFFDDTREFVVDASFEAKYQCLADQLAIFGDGSDPVRLFKIGPHAELLGKKLSSLRVQGESSHQIHPINFEGAVLHQEDGFVPALLQSMVTPWENLATPGRFAIAINDVVWGTTSTYHVKYLRNYWRVMLPEAAFEPGANKLRIFEIDDSNSELVLRECPISGKALPPFLPSLE